LYMRASEALNKRVKGSVSKLIVTSRLAGGVG